MAETSAGIPVEQLVITIEVQKEKAEKALEEIRKKLEATFAKAMPGIQQMAKQIHQGTTQAKAAADKAAVQMEKVAARQKNAFIKSSNQIAKQLTKDSEYSIKIARQMNAALAQVDRERLQREQDISNAIAQDRARRAAEQQPSTQPEEIRTVQLRGTKTATQIFAERARAQQAEMQKMQEQEKKLQEAFTKAAPQIEKTAKQVQQAVSSVAPSAQVAAEQVKSATDKMIAQFEILERQIELQRKKVEILKKALADSADPKGQEKLKLQIEAVSIAYDKLIEKQISLKEKMESPAQEVAEPIGKSAQKAIPPIKKLGTELQATAKKGKTAFEKLGATIVRVFKFAVAYKALRALFTFISDGIKSAINAPEIENMFRVAFGAGADEAAKFAEAMQKAFGIDPYATKQMLGTFQNMSTAMGVGTKNAAEMSKGLTLLANDMASLYNVDPQQAAENLQSALSGQGRAVRKYGYIILDSTIKETAYRLGIAETGAELTEQQKVLARYMTLQEQSKNAQGDLARTIQNVANQLRILKQNIVAAGRSIGTAFIPFIQAATPFLNGFFVLLQRLGNALSTFTFGLFGINFAEWKKEQEAIIGGTGDMSQAEDEYADSIDKAAKAQKGLLSGFDKLNISQRKSEGAGATGGASGEGGFDIPKIEAPKGESPFEKMADNAIIAFKKINAAFTKHVAKPFENGFEKGIASADFGNLKQSIKGIGSTLTEVFTNPKVTNSFQNYISTLSEQVGKSTGSFVSIGTSLSNGLVGGFNKFLTDNKESIQNHLVSIFDISSQTSKIIGDFNVTLAEIAQVFGGENAQKAVSNYIGIFYEIEAGVAEIGARIGRDFAGLVSAPFIENKEKIKTALDEMLGNVESVFGTIKETIARTFEEIVKTYDINLKPLIETVKGAFSEWFSHILDGWNNDIQPVLNEFAVKLRETVEEHVMPMIEKAVGFFGKLFDALKLLWDNILKPLVSWLIDKAVPFIVGALEHMASAFDIVLTVVSDVIGSIFQIFGGVLEFITGVFTGDWKKAWEGVVNIFKGVFNIIPTIIETVLNTGITLINKLIAGLNGITGIVGIPKIPEIPKSNIPRLAGGGVLTAPRIVMAGEYPGARTNPEIVTPQSLMYETSLKAQQAANQPVIAIMSQVLQAIRDGKVIELDGYEVGRQLDQVRNNNNLLLGI